jgi:DNA-binding SARP family transcriptional activator
MDFRILGPLEARVDGRELPLGGAKQRALLALLLLHRNEVVSIDRLIDGLWGGEPPPTASKVVQVYVSRLRRLLGPPEPGHGRLVTRSPGYLLEVAPDELDLERFEGLVEEARRASATGDPAVASAALRLGLAMWRGPPLADLAFEPFAQEASARLEDQRVAAVESRVEADLALARAPELVGELGALVREHPFRERLRSFLMLALYRSGRQAEALEAYRAARRSLVDELGIEPSPGLAELERAILRHDPALVLPPPPAPAPSAGVPIASGSASAAVDALPSPPAPAIVGREPVLLRIDECLEASAAQGAVLRIIGDAGLGKTRLVQEAAARARARGRLVLEGRATPMEAAMPLGVFRDAVRADRRARPDAATPDDPLAASFPSWLLPELGAPPGEDEMGGGVLFEAACRYFRALARPAGLVLVLEDLHRADSSSHALVHYLARTCAGDPLCLVLTHRPCEAGEDSTLERLVQELVHDRRGDEIALRPLDEPDVARMVENLLGLPPDPEAHAAIAAMSGGNPFAVEELVRAAVEEGRLSPASGRWRADGRETLPQTVREMLLARIRRLRPGDRELLLWAATAGESCDLPLLIAVSGSSEGQVLAGLERLHQAGLVVDDHADEGRRLTFRHALIREAVVEELTGSESRRRHRRLLDAMENLYAGRQGAPFEELVAHALAAEDRERSFRYSVQAARDCLRMGGYGEARAHYQRALDLWEPGAGAEQRASLLLSYGRLLMRVTHEPRALDLLDQAREGYEALGDRIGAAAARAAAAEARYNLGETGEAVADARALASELGPETAHEARLLAFLALARLLSMRGEVADAVEIATEALELVPHAPSRPQAIARARLLNVLGGSTWLRGDDVAGTAAMLESARLAGELGDHVSEVRAYTNLALSAAFYSSGPLEAAAGWADAGLAVTSARGLLPAEGWLSAIRAAIHLEAGEDADAGPLLERAENALAGAGRVPHVRLALEIGRAERHLSRAALDEAAAGFAGVLAQADELRHPGSAWLVRDGLARARLAAGDSSGARDALAPAMVALRAEPTHLRSFAWLAASAVEVATALGDIAGAADLAQWLSRNAPGDLARYARAVADAAGAAPARAREIEAAARGVEEGGRRSRAARMRLTGATALARGGGGDAPDGRPAVEALAAAALASFRALGRDGWCRTAERLLRRPRRRLGSHGGPEGPRGAP